MPRKPRYFLPGVPVHIVQRGNNRQAIFFDDQDYHAYLQWLGEALVKYDCSLHAYVLMTNHVHLLITPPKKESLSRVMQYVGRRYVPYINHTYRRTGTLWEGRFKASLIQDEHYLLACMRYIELNPVRANMVKTASGYRWSSYLSNGRGFTNALVTPHDRYLAIANADIERRETYRDLFRCHMDEEVITGIRQAWQTGTPLGNDYFKAQVEQMLKMKVGYAKRGRPTINSRNEKGL